MPQALGLPDKIAELAKCQGARLREFTPGDPGQLYGFFVYRDCRIKSGNDRQRRLLAREVGVGADKASDVVFNTVAILDDRGTAGGSAACLHIGTIRVPIALALFITTDTIIALTISIIRT